MRLLLILSLPLFLCSACATVGDGDKTAKSGAIGTVAGAAAGAVWGHARGDAAKGALIGAAVGGGLGLLTGAVLDKQEEELRKAGLRTERDSAGNLVVTMSGDSLKFDTGKTTLKPEGEAMLLKIAEVVNKYPENRIGIEGHTDDVGKESSNLLLSRGRANTVKSYLLSKGLPARSVVGSTGFGESRPVADNKSAAGKALNRRVELKISVDAEEADRHQKERELYKNSKKK
jgi:outer membrane protein OmpA-like peptidoglycan-associated protein